jgi:hypothetical protein
MALVASGHWDGKCQGNKEIVKEMQAIQLTRCVDSDL